MPTSSVDSRGRVVFVRVQRSTRLVDRGQALQLAITFERAAKLAAEKDWSEYSARRFLEEVRVLSSVSTHSIQPAEPFIQSWLQTKRATAAKKSWANINSVLAGFISWLGNRRQGPISDLTPRVIAEFRDAELAAGKSPTTINKSLSFLSQMFDEAAAQGCVEKNPARGLRLKGAKKRAQKRHAFTFDQFRALVRCVAPGSKGTHGGATSDDWQSFILVTGYTGGRQQEVAQLRWKNVDFAGRRIGLVRTKSGGDIHWVPMHTALFEHLRARADRIRPDPADFVMPEFATIEERYLSKSFRELILPRIGIHQPYAEASLEKGRGRRLAQFSIHSLRHSLPTWLNDHGVSEMMRMRIVGHEDTAVSRGYTHTELENARHELAKLPSV